MKKLLSSLLIMALLTIISGITFSTPVKAAANYYVSYTDGNDNNNGTSSSTPWKTLKKASSVTYQAGDQLLFKCGDTWNEQLYLTGTGTTASPITVASYSAGNAPKIFGNWPTSTPTKVNDNNGSITYSGTWGYNTGAAGYYNNDYHYSGNANSYVEYTFTGTTVSWVGPLGSNAGKADVYIDSLFQETVDLYNSTNYLQLNLYTKTALPYGSHTIKIVVRSDKNPSSSGYNVLVDAFEYSSGIDAGITVDTPSGWKIKDLEISNFIWGLRANSRENTNLSYLWLENLTIHDCYLADHSLTQGDPLPLGISIGSGNTGTATSLSDITIKNCQIENCTVGIDIGAGGDASNHNIKNVTISGITAIDIGSSPLSISGVENATVTELITVHSADDYIFVGSCNGFSCNSKNITFTNCEFADGQRNNCYDGAAFDYEGANNGVKFDKCLFHDSAGPAVMIMNNPAYNSNIEIKNSVFYNDNLSPDPRSLYTPLGEIALLGQDESGTVYDNKFYISNHVGYKGGQEKNTNPNLDFYNNTEVQESVESNGTNFSLSATASASTDSGTSGNVKDGSAGTSWSASSSANQWVQLDFGTSKSVNKFIVKEAGGSSINRFQMQYWDSTNSVWKSCFNGKTIGTKRVMPIIPVTTTKVRLFINNTASGNPSISEFEAYNATPPAHTDEFSSGTLEGAWSWIRQDAANWSLSARPGYMRINLQGQDIWGAANTTENILIRSAPSSSDWVIKTKLKINPYTNYQHAGLIVRKDDDNYIKLAYGYDSGITGGLSIECAKEINASPTNIKVTFNSNPIYLRITKTGTTYKLEYSDNGISWNLGTTYTGVDFTSYNVGLIAQQTAGAYGEFEWFDASVLIDNNFNAETTGSIPGGWTIDSSGGTVTVQIVPSSSDKSVRIYDTSTSNVAAMSKTFTVQRDCLMASAMIRSEQSSHGLDFDLGSGSTVIGALRLHSNGYITYTDSAGEHNIQTYSTGAFYKLAFIVDIKTNKFDVYVNDVLKASNCSFQNNVTYIDKINISSWGSTAGTHYVDNVIVSGM